MPNPESLILNILLWDIIKMTHQIAFVNYWIMLLQQVFRKAPFNYSLLKSIGTASID